VVLFHRRLRAEFVQLQNDDTIARATDVPTSLFLVDSRLFGVMPCHSACRGGRAN
jgi:hypothetical protein